MVYSYVSKAYHFIIYTPTMKKTLFIVLWALFALGGSIFAHGSTNHSSTATGTNSGMVYLSICINDAAAVKNTALLGINNTYINAVKNASTKLQTSIDVAKASWKTDAEIEVMISNSFITWRADVKAARTVANDARKVAKSNFDSAKAACKDRYQAAIQVDDSVKDHKKDKDKNWKYENKKWNGFGLGVKLMKKHYSNDNRDGKRGRK